MRCMYISKAYIHTYIHLNDCTSTLIYTVSAAIDMSRTRGPCESPGSDLIMIKFVIVLFLLLSLSCIMMNQMATVKQQ